MLARPVGASSVMEILFALGTNTPRMQRTYAATAGGISAASTEDPLFPDHVSGGSATACLLLALAWRRTGLWPYGTYDGGRMGLFLLRVPAGKPIDGGLLLLPQTAAYVAIDQIRRSIAERRGPLEHSLASFLAWNDGVRDTRVLPESRDILGMAMRLLATYMPPPTNEEPLLLGAGAP